MSQDQDHIELEPELMEPELELEPEPSDLDYDEAFRTNNVALINVFYSSGNSYIDLIYSHFDCNAPSLVTILTRLISTGELDRIYNLLTPNNRIHFLTDIETRLKYLRDKATLINHVISSLGTYTVVTPTSSSIDAECSTIQSVSQ
jgi:hypothetical protein